MADPASFDAELDLPDKLFFRIGEAAGLIGVEPHVLRYWEGEFRLRPQRSASGQRMYRRQDIARFMRIRKLLHEEGFTIAGARRALRAGVTSTAVVAGAAPTVDTAQVSEGLQRVQDARQRIAEFSERISRMGISGVAAVDDA